MSATATIRKIYLYQILNDFILLYPLYNIMFADRGLSTFQISTLLIIWSATSILTNVPTGVLADRFPRKNLLALAQLITAAGFVTWLLLPHYWGFALGFVLWGLGGALFDGTYEALVFDELKAAKRERDYVKVMGRAHSLALISQVAATALAAPAVLLGYGFVVGVSAAVLVISSLVAFSLPVAQASQQVAELGYFAALGKGIREAVHSRTLLGVILLGGFIGATYGSLEEYVPLFFTDAGFSHSATPLIVAATVLVAAIASLVAFRYQHLSTETFIGLLGVSGLALVGGAVFLGAASVVLLVLYTFLIKMLVTIFDGKIQHAMSGELRATVTSVAFFAVEAMSVVVYFFYGLISEHGGNVDSFKISGTVVIGVALLYLALAPRILQRESLPT